MNKVSFLLLVYLLTSVTVFCQDVKDTVFFDEDWSICEKPVAEYYRVCELNRDNIFYYKGTVKDYYINGNLEMAGDYGADGNKNGEFIFYNNKGIIIKKGDFLNNVMMGDWYFYDSIGRLRSQFFCKTQFDFTPVLLIDSKSDTIVKNGNGEFALNDVTDYPYINSKYGFIVKGTVRNGVKDGDFKYYIYPKKQLLFTERYEDGRFVKSQIDPYAYAHGWSDNRLYLLSLNDINLDKKDAFYHSNIVFGAGLQGTQKLSNFLRYNIAPVIPAPSGFSAKDKICFNIIFKILVDDFIKDSIFLITNDIEDGNKSETLSTSALTVQQINKLRKLYGNITLTVDTTGQISECMFKTNLSGEEVVKLNYYLRKVSNLPVATNKDEKISRTLNLKLNTIIDTIKTNVYTLNYVLNNPKEFIPPDITGDTSIISNGTVQIEAKFPGGSVGWQKYLEKNLNSQVPSDHGAPNGNYTVIISFLVDEEGNVSDVIALKDPGYGTAEEAVRVIKNEPRWIPAVKDGKHVPYRQKQNIIFQVVNH